MKIKTLELNNFRNISHAVYQLDETNIIVAKNHTGKTNTLTAPHWVLTDKLLNNSSNDTSLKTIGKTELPVEVKMTIETEDGSVHTIEKIYKEHWTKSKGSCELSLTGHDIIYKIDEIEQKKNSTAKEEIAKMLNLDSEKVTKALKGANVYQALMNPLYLAEQLEWKTLRMIIISIIGEISNDEVYAYAPETMSVDPLLKKYNYEVEKLVTFCTQQVTGLNKTIIELEAQRKLLEKTEDIPEEEMKRIEKEIETQKSFIKAITEVSNGDNPLIKKYEDERTAAINECRELLANEKTEWLKKVQEESTKAQELKEKVNDYSSRIQDFKNQLQQLENRQSACTYELNRYKREIDEITNSLIACREEYIQLKNEPEKTFESLCPHCGGVINQQEAAALKEEHQKKHQAAIEQNIAKGKGYKLALSESQIKKEESEKALLDIEKNKTRMMATIEALESDYNKACTDYNAAYEMTPKIEDFTPSVKIKDLTAKAEELMNEIYKLKAPAEKRNEDAENQIAKINATIEELKKKTGQHYVYLNAMDRVSSMNVQIKEKQKERAAYEMNKELALQFNKTKLDIMEKRLDEHFNGEVKWVLVETNIKEGSWNNVCYPLIIGTKTPFIMGSTSERVMTGIKIIEVIKRELELPNLPILIDEIGELDSESLTRLQTITKSQIIATKVDDNFDEPTIYRL